MYVMYIECMWLYDFNKAEQLQNVIFFIWECRRSSTQQTNTSTNAYI